eukprot:COSAG06_NODE_10330_length_1701_cov_1.552434_3_plen_106_part_00
MKFDAPFIYSVKVNAALRLDALRSIELFVTRRYAESKCALMDAASTLCPQTVEIKDTVRVSCYRSNTSGSSGTFMPVLHVRRGRALSTSALRVKEEERSHIAANT